MVKPARVRRSISSKIFLILFSSVLILFLATIMILTFSLDKIALQETYFRLSNYITITGFEWRNGNMIVPDENDNGMHNFGIIQGRYENGNYIVEYGSANLINVLSQNEISGFLSQAKRGTNIYENSKNEEIYYACEVDELTNYFIIVLVDDSYNEGFVKRIIGSIITFIIAALIILSLIASFWINKLLKRLKALQNHITNMSKEKYEVEYLDDGDDEIRELSESIEIMRLEIKDSETTKREMLQNVSHDFKTPIAVIKNYAEAIVDGVVDTSDANIIIKQADILRTKVNQLLQYNRLEYLNKDKPLEEVDLADVCNEVVNNHKVNTKIEFKLELEPCVFEGYRENFVTVVENIVENALRYAKTVIYIQTKGNKVTIYNDGEPIEEKFLNSKFKPYEKGSKGEFGLGMSIVQKTLDFFGLSLSIYNEERGGVSFIIYKKE